MQTPANDNPPPKGYAPAAREPVLVIVMSGEGWGLMLGIPAPISAAPAPVAFAQTPTS